MKEQIKIEQSLIGDFFEVLIKDTGGVVHRIVYDFTKPKVLECIYQIIYKDYYYIYLKEYWCMKTFKRIRKKSLHEWPKGYEKFKDKYDA